MIGIAAVLVVSLVQAAAAWQPEDPEVRAGGEPLRLNCDELRESSGLAFSQRNEHFVWSHNDSGDRAQLFAFNDSGGLTGRVVLRGVKATDFEDMASYRDDGPRLLVADVGDNDANRSEVSLYLFDEPAPHKSTRVPSFQHLVVHYPGGPQNCESVAVDVKQRRILLLGKSALVATMHAVPLPPKPKPGDADGPQVQRIDVKAEPIARVAIPLATGMDICPVTGDLWVSGYLHAYRYANPKDQPLTTLLKSLPEMVELPKLKQVEAIAVDSSGAIWVTSEGRPAMMQRVEHSR